MTWLIAGRPSTVAGILIIAFGRSTVVHSERAASIVFSVALVDELLQLTTREQLAGQVVEPYGDPELGEPGQCVGHDLNLSWPSWEVSGARSGEALLGRGRDVLLGESELLVELLVVGRGT